MFSFCRYTITYKTEFIKNTLSPKWRPFTVPVRTLCNGDLDRSIKVECYDWNSNGSHEIIGSFLTNLRELSQRGCSFEVYTNSILRPAFNFGVVFFYFVHQIYRPMFL